MRIMRICMEIIVLFMLSCPVWDPVTATQQIDTDTLGMYARLTGEYEFYSEERYSPISISLKERVLIGHERGCDPITITPVNLHNLEFSASNGVDHFKVTFVEDPDGRIVRLVLGTQEGDEPAERITDETRPEQFAVSELQEDLMQLRRAMEQNGDILYQYTDKESFARLFEKQFERLTGSMSVEEFRRVIAPVVSQVGCLHTSLWMPPGYWKHTPASLIPLRLVFLKDGCFVWRSYLQPEVIPAGSEILAINGQPILDIADAITSNISADGYNDSFRKFKVNEGFSFRYWLEFGSDHRFTFTCRFPDQSEQKAISLDAVNLEMVEQSGLEKNSTEYNELDYTRDFRILEEKNAAILTLRSFAYYDHPEICNTFIDSVFKIIHERGIVNLILDLRNNNGGNPFCSVHLFSYLEPRPLPYFAEEYGRYAALAHPVPPAEKPFRGRLFTLINGNNVSTTPHFCALLKYHDIGTFIGSETGGTYACNAATKEIHLKHSRFIVTLSTKSFAAAVEGFSRDRGIMPDYPVERTIDDLIAGRDSILDFALSLIGQ